MDPGVWLALCGVVGAERPVHEEISRTFRAEPDHHRGVAVGRASPTRALCLPRSTGIEIRSW